MRDREFYIQNIRSHLPYMPEHLLPLLNATMEGLIGSGANFSVAEHDRLVLSVEQQKQADCATLCMRAIGFAICPEMDGKYCIKKSAEEAGNAIGMEDGDVIIMDARKVAQVYRSEGGKRVKQADLFTWMEEAGYILPRNSRPKKALIDGEKCDVLYVPVKKFRPFRWRGDRYGAKEAAV